MKVFLIKPPFSEIYGQFKAAATEYPPLGLAYMAAVLEKEGHEVKIIDMPAERTDEDKLKKFLEEFKPDIVGITVVTPTINYSLKIAGVIKEIIGCPVVLGGIHPTTMSDEVIANKMVDFVVRREGEYALPELLKIIQNKGDLNKCKGIVWKNGNKIIHNEDRQLIENLDELLLPARHLIKMDKYHYVDVKEEPMTTMMTSRGCPGQCVYCDAHNLFGCKFRARSAKSVVDEIEILVNEYKIREIHFIDDTFTLNRRRVEEICDEIKKRKLKFFWTCPNGVRVDTITKELLERMKDAGCYGLAFGVESGDQGILNNIRKGTTLEKIREVFRLCKEIGLETWGFFMFGLPGDTEETIKKTIDFAIELDPDVAKFHITVPYPGTELFNQWQDAGYLKEKDWSKYGIHVEPIFEMPSVSSEKIMELHRLAYKKFYLRPKYLFKAVKRMNSIPRIKNNIAAGFSIIKYALTG